MVPLIPFSVGWSMDKADLDLVLSLIELFGVGAVAERLKDVSHQMVIDIAVGNGVLSQVHMAILRAWNNKVFGGDGAEYHGGPSEVVVEEIEDDEPPEMIGIDMDGDGKDDVLVNIVQARPGASWTDEQKQIRDGMRRSLAFAQMSRFRVDMTHQQYVSSLGVVTRLEVGLISWFGESVPDPLDNWDASRRWREVERRIARLRWVSDEESKEFSGIKGILNRIMGRRRMSGKEMYEKMVAEADWMVAAMRSGRQDADVISEVASYVGLAASPPSLPGR